MAKTSEEKRAYQRAYAARQWASETPEQRDARRLKGNATTARYRARNPEKTRERGRIYRAANLEKERARNRLLMRVKAGIVDATDETRSGSCEICTTHADTLHYDHDHQTGKRRGWLCQTCNRGLGHFKDTRELLLAAAAYLEKFQ